MNNAYRYCRLALVAGAFLLPAVAWTQGRDSAQTRRELLEFENARFAAMVRADTAWLRDALSDTLTYVHSSGRIETKAEYLAAVAAGSLQYQEFTPRERQVHLLGPTAAAVAGLAHTRAISAGQPIEVDVRYLAVYERSGNRWQLVAWQTTRVATSS